jgi:hypothetical protein
LPIEIRSDRNNPRARFQIGNRSELLIGILYLPTSA